MISDIGNKRRRSLLLFVSFFENGLYGTYEWTKVPCKVPCGMLWPVAWTLGYSSIVYVIPGLEGLVY